MAIALISHALKAAAPTPMTACKDTRVTAPAANLVSIKHFDTAKFIDDTLYMPDFDVCAEVSSHAAGTSVDLAECNGSDAQKFTFSGKGTITPVLGPEMCFTVGEATRTGRRDQNQIKVLSLETCAAAHSAFQTWNVRGVDQ